MNDYYKHFVVGAIISIVAYLALVNLLDFNESINLVAALLIAVIAGVVKEYVIDKRTQGKPDNRDILYTAWGAFIGLAAYQFISYLFRVFFVLVFFFSAFGFSQEAPKFKKAIITENEHIYDPVNNLSCKMIRVINPNRGVQFSDDKVDVYIEVYGQIFETQIDENGNEIEVEILKPFTSFGNHSTYKVEEIDAFFKQLNNPLYPSESFMNELNSMLLQILLYDSSQRQLFGADTFEIYKP